MLANSMKPKKEKLIPDLRAGRLLILETRISFSHASFSSTNEISDAGKRNDLKITCMIITFSIYIIFNLPLAPSCIFTSPAAHLIFSYHGSALTYFDLSFPLHKYLPVTVPSSISSQDSPFDHNRRIEGEL